MDQLTRIEVKLDMILKNLGLTFQDENPVEQVKPVIRRERIGKRQRGITADLLMGMTRDEIISRNGLGAIASVYDNYDPAFMLGAATKKGACRRMHGILDEWFQGYSLGDILEHFSYIDNVDVKATLFEYYKAFGLSGIFDPMPGAAEALSKIKTYPDGNLKRVASDTEVPLVQVVRDYVKKGPLWVLDEQSHNILCNLMRSAATMFRSIDYNVEPYIKDMIINKKPVQCHLRWCDSARANVYRVQLQGKASAAVGKYIIETRPIGQTRWRYFNGGSVVTDPSTLYAILDGIAVRQIRRD